MILTNKKHWIFALIITLLLTSLLFAQDLKKEGRYWVGEIHKTFAVEQTGSLIMDEVRGDVTIRTWDKKEVRIYEIKKMDIFTRAEAEAAMDESQNGYVQTGKTIEISGPAFEREWIRSRFTITIPEGFECDIKTQGGDLDISGTRADVNASTGGGDITLHRIDGNVDSKTGGGDIDISEIKQKVMARTGGGDIDIENTEGDVSASSGGGDITIMNTNDRVQAATGGGDVRISQTQGNVTVTTGGGNINIDNAGGDVTVTTGGGEISIRNVIGKFISTTGGGDIDGKMIKGSLKVTTGGGDVRLTGVHGAANVTTGGGDVELELSLEDTAVDHHLNITTGGGNIDLYLPENITATVDAEIKYRERTWEDYDITSDFPLNITKEKEDTRYQVIRATGDINGGGDLMRLKTGGGNINIRKK